MHTSPQAVCLASLFLRLSEKGYKTCLTSLSKDYKEVETTELKTETGIQKAQETAKQLEIRKIIDLRSSTKQLNSWRYKAQRNNSTAGDTSDLPQSVYSVQDTRHVPKLNLGYSHYQNCLTAPSCFTANTPKTDRVTQAQHRVNRIVPPDSLRKLSSDRVISSQLECADQLRVYNSVRIVQVSLRCSLQLSLSQLGHEAFRPAPAPRSQGTYSYHLAMVNPALKGQLSSWHSVIPKAESRLRYLLNCYHLRPLHWTDSRYRSIKISSRAQHCYSQHRTHLSACTRSGPARVTTQQASKLDFSCYNTSALRTDIILQQTPSSLHVYAQHMSLKQLAPVLTLPKTENPIAGTERGDVAFMKNLQKDPAATVRTLSTSRRTHSRKMSNLPTSIACASYSKILGSFMPTSALTTEPRLRTRSPRTGWGEGTSASSTQTSLEYTTQFASLRSACDALFSFRCLNQATKLSDQLTHPDIQLSTSAVDSTISSTDFRAISVCVASHHSDLASLFQRYGFSPSQLPDLLRKNKFLLQSSASEIEESFEILLSLKPSQDFLLSTVGSCPRVLELEFLKNWQKGLLKLLIVAN
ncbi:hypothetical protein F511_36090 [Dorcoceras hygrometricum]|uniref:Uncharacterized protein n=1 Tax=Dorcoceras hygrometricum TaxID=472368 RepID=A0A2Z7AS50_9LAMI|nr:hypothetical protein F511_36090 [Dorcoceras hygrometricum]